MRRSNFASTSASWKKLESAKRASGPWNSQTWPTHRRFYTASEKGLGTDQFNALVLKTQRLYA